MCGDPCKCEDGHKKCGSVFAPSCNLEPKSLYDCSGPGATPSKLEACTAECEHTSPDHQCKIDCTPQVMSMSAQIDAIIEQMNLLMKDTLNSGNITLLAYPPLIKTLEEAKAEMLADAARPEKLNLEAGTLRNTIIGARSVMDAIRPLFPKKNVNASLPLIQDLDELVPLIDSVIACSGGNQSDCSGITQLLNDYKDAAVKRINEIETTSSNSTAVKDIAQKFQDVTDIIDKVFETRDDSTLPAAGKTLNEIIGTMSGSFAIYSNASDGVNLYYEAAKEALKCEGFNITEFADKCAGYGYQLQGALDNILKYIQDLLNNVPILGPLISTPILDALREAVGSIQDGAGTGIGKTAGILVGILQIVGIAPGTEDETSDPVKKSLLAFLGIATVAGDCGSPEDKCMGAIEIARILLQAAVNIVANLPFPLNLAAAPLKVVVDQVAAALDSGSGATIATAAAALKLAADGINLTTGGATTTVLGTLVSGLEQIVTCLTTDKGTTP
ncbi:hypothetical protein BGZ95_012014 [Linnemannia exigua]|uniref:Uncharacterized protein n=1 Tax=Linnemannia exigua TaxID=604196 RepID=A0AAD4H4V0_9FUNG|nr:hypothetical protein BGZ95_012014 [Linnemannia exigua]